MIVMAKDVVVSDLIRIQIYDEYAVVDIYDLVICVQHAGEHVTFCVLNSHVSDPKPVIYSHSFNQMLEVVK